MDQLNQSPDIPTMGDDDEKTIVLKDNIMCERKIRCYVKKGGGFRKDLPGADKTAFRRLAKEWNECHKGKNDEDRTEADGWNMGLMVPGFELAVAMAPTVKPEFAQQLLMDKMSKQLDEQAEIIKAQGATIKSMTSSKRGGKQPKTNG